MHRLSVVIISLDEAENIVRCIRSVHGLADEVLVVDSGSTDGTQETASSLGARVVHQDFLGYMEQKNFATALAKFDWILSLDADEALTPDLHTEIRQELQNPDFHGYYMPRLTNFCGHWVRHSGWYPDRKLRLYDRRYGSWTGARIHERYQLREGLKAGFLKHDILHYSYNSLSDHLRQIDRFSALGAQALYEKGVKSSSTKLIIKTLARFFRTYFINGGFRDGLTGLVIAVNSSHAVFLKYLRLIYLHKGRSE